MRAAVAVLATVSILLLPTSASAADPEVVFTGETSQTLEYGQFWQFALRFPNYAEQKYTFVSNGTPSGYEPELYAYVDPADSGMKVGAISAPYDVAPLTAGTYSFTVRVVGSDAGVTTFEGETASPAQLTVAPAKLGMSVRVVPDPSDPTLALVTAAFTGRFVDEYQSSFFSGAAISPAGEWRISFVDSSKTEVIVRSVERAAGDDTLATSFAWADGEPGEIYTVSAEFVPSGTSAQNFTVAPAAPFSYTAAESARPVPSSTATGQPDAALPAASGFGLPLWSVIIAGVIILGLAVLLTILSVRLGRPSTAATKEVVA